jgi:integrase
VLRASGPQTTDQLTTALANHGRAIRPVTVQVALGELVAAELVADADGDGQQHWGALPRARKPLLEAVDLHGAHDFRHTFATWLEDAGIPARVIDEVMGHEATSRAGQQRGSAMGAHYRHTTPEMAARVVEAIQQRLTIVLHVADESLENNPNRLAPGVF